MATPPSPERFVPVADPRPEDVPWPPMQWPPGPAVRLRGQYVELAPCDPARDAPALFAALDADVVWRHLHLSRPRDAGQHRELLVRQESPDRWTWIVRLLRSVGGLPAGAVVGTTSYAFASLKDARLEIGGTAYAPAVWASKVNPEAKLLLLEHAFEVLRAGRVQLKTDARNVRSQQAIARLGARYEGTLRRERRRADGTVRDSVLFSIIAEEWPGVREGLMARLRE